MIAARIAPTWMIAVNAVTPLSSILRSSSFSAIVRWPVDETGKNSVSPSTIPSTIDFQISTGDQFSGRRRLHTERATRPYGVAHAAATARPKRAGGLPAGSRHDDVGPRHRRRRRRGAAQDVSRRRWDAAGHGR